MSGQFDISIFVRLTDQLTAPARHVQTSMERMAAGMRQAAASASTGMVGAFNTAFQKIGNGFRNFGAEMKGHWENLQSNAMGSILLTAGVAESFKEQLKFEESVMNIQAFRLDKTGKATDALREKIVRLAATYPILDGRQGLIEGAEQLVKLNQSVEDTIALARPLAQISAAAHIASKDAAEGLIHVSTAAGMTLPGMSGADKEKIGDLVGNSIFAAMKAFGGKYEDLVFATVRGAPTGRMMGVPFSVTVAEMAGLMRSGFAPESAGVAMSALMLRTATLGMTKQTKEAAETLKTKYGIDIDAYRHSPAEFSKWGGANLAASIRGATGLDFSDLAPQFQGFMDNKTLQESADLMRSKLIDAAVATGRVNANDPAGMAKLYQVIDKELMAHFAQTDVLSFLRDLSHSPAAHDMKFVKQLAGVYHIPKLADLLFQFETGDFDQKLADYYDHITGATKIHTDMWGNSIAGAWERMKAMMGVFQERLWHNSGLLNVVHEVFDRILGFTDKIVNAAPGTLNALRYVGEGLLALTVATPVGLALWAVGAAISTLLNPLVMGAGALAYFGYQLYANQEAILAWWNSLSTASQLLAGGVGLVTGLAAIRYALRALSLAVAASPFGWAMRLAALGALVYENWSQVVGVFERLKKTFEDSAFGKWLDGARERKAALEATNPNINRGWGFSWSPNTREDAVAEKAAHDFVESVLKHLKRGERWSGSIPNRMGGGDQGAARTESKTVNSNNTFHISTTVQVQNSTQAPAVVGQAVGAAVGAQMRGTMHDLPQ